MLNIILQISIWGIIQFDNTQNLVCLSLINFAILIKNYEIINLKKKEN